MSRKFPSVAKRFSFLKGTVFHPQWFAHREESRLFSRIGSIANGIVLDVGCSDQRVRQYLGDGVNYLGVDYFQTASQWYGTRPAIYGDAHSLPIASESVDTILLLDVLEHLKAPEQCFLELHRVLRPGGTLVLKVPFIYPIHDAPLDFHRWTRFGLASLGEKSGFSIETAAHLGHPLQTAALIVNIALSKTVLNWLRSRNPLAILGAFLPIAVVVTNTTGLLAGALSKADEMMPHGYFWILKKPG